MGDLRKNISRWELSCKCGCGYDSMDGETLDVVQDCCDHFAKEQEVDRVMLHITSGARCYEHNNKPVSEGGAGSNKNSQHPRARAIDFWIGGVAPSEVYQYLSKKYQGRFGFGEYNTFTHADTRSGPVARWG